MRRALRNKIAFFFLVMYMTTVTWSLPGEYVYAADVTYNLTTFGAINSTADPVSDSYFTFSGTAAGNPHAITLDAYGMYINNNAETGTIKIAPATSGNVMRLKSLKVGNGQCGLSPPTTYHYHVRFNDTATVVAECDVLNNTASDTTYYTFTFDPVVSVSSVEIDISGNASGRDGIYWGGVWEFTVAGYPAEPSMDATLDAATKIKGVTVTDFGTPASTITGVTAGSVALSAEQGADTSNAGSFVTSFVAHDAAATVSRIVKYANGDSTAAFETQAVYDGTAAVTNGDFFIAKVTAESGAVNYYKIVVSMSPPSAPVASSADNVAAASFRANWGAVAGATKYYLDVATDPGFGAGTLVSGWDNKDAGNVANYTVNTNITPGTTYYYRIRAYNSIGTSGNSNTMTVVTIPASPVASAATSIGNASFQANWSASTGATKYYLDVATDSGFGAGMFVTGWQNVDVGNVTSVLVDTNISPGTTYYYRVRAFNTGGVSPNSGATTVLTVPSAPASTAASIVRSASFTANWAASTGATKYYLDIATDSGFGAGTLVSGWDNKDVGNVTTYSVNSGLSAGQTYYYRVRAYNASGTSGNSGTITVLPAPPAPVASAASSLGTDRFTANWSASTGATKYYIDVATDSGFGAGTFVAGWQNVDADVLTHCTVSTGLSAGTTYYYRVRAFNANGTSDNSNVITVVTVPPAPVSAAASNINSSSFSANWASATGASGYYLDVSTDSGFSAGTFVTGWQTKDVGNVTTVSVNSGLNAGQTYYYRVRAYNGTHAGDNSGTITVTLASPAPVASAASSITTASFQANWASSTGATKYYLDVATDSSFGAGTFVAGWQNVDVGNVTTYSVNSGLAAGQTYYYRVRAFSASGISSNSNAITVVTIPAAPVSAAASNIDSSSFSANWGTVPGAMKYYLDVATDSGFGAGTFVTGWQNVDVGNVVTYSVNSGLSAGQTYYYRVRAYNASGTSVDSGTITVTLAPPAPVANAASSIIAASFKANWAASTGATKYYLDVATDSGFGAGTFVAGWQNVDVGNVTTYSVNSGLSAGNTYYYRIRAWNANGTSSNSDVITVLTVPGAPVCTAATSVSSTGFIANWGTVPGATKYYLDVATDNGFSSYAPGWQNVDAGNAANCLVTGLNGNTQYYYRVRAYNVSGTGANSNTITNTTCPAAPVATAAGAINKTAFTANWNSSAGATKYYLDVATDNGFISFVTGWQNVDVGNVTSCPVNSGLAAGQTYYYRVRAWSASGSSGNSNVQTLVTIPPEPVATGANATSSGSFIANWNPADGATVYHIDVATDNAFTQYLTGWQDRNVGNCQSVTVTGSLNPVTDYYYRVRASNANGASGSSNIVKVTTLASSSDSPASPSPSSPSSPGTPESPGTPQPEGDQNSSPVLINDVPFTAATTVVVEQDGQQVVTVTLNDSVVQGLLDDAGPGSTVTIPVEQEGDAISAQFSGSTLTTMNGIGANLEIQTGSAIYTLPAGQIDLAGLAAQLGVSDNPEAMSFTVNIGTPPAPTVQIIEDAAGQLNYTLVVPPMEFTLTCAANGQVIEISNFSGFVSRAIAIPEGVDPSLISTGAIANPDGTFSPVPTQIVEIDGQPYALISSLSNSIYTVISNKSPIMFTDTQNHWGRDIIAEMAERLIVNGVGNGLYEPDRGINRAEFAAMLGKSLGIAPASGSCAFSDVNEDAWYCGTVKAVVERGLMHGYSDGSFQPAQTITRQEAIVSIAAALKLCGVENDLSEAEIAAILGGFSDEEQLGSWARSSTALCAKLGVISGKDGRIAPRDPLTRAEVASILMMMLEKGGLI